MTIKGVRWLSPRRVTIDITDNDSFDSFTVNIKSNIFKVLFQDIPHIVYLNNNIWEMVEEEIYEV